MAFSISLNFYRYKSSNLSCPCSINGIKRDNLGTYGILSGIINSGFNFGSTLAPAVAGTITQYLGFAWTSIVATGLYTVMVSSE